MTYKICPKCKQEWETLGEFLFRTKPVCLTDFSGLTLVNCACGTTIAIEATEAFPHLRDELFRLWNSDKNFRWAPCLREARIKRLKSRSAEGDEASSQ